MISIITDPNKLPRYGVWPGPTLAPVYRANKHITWRIFGRNNTIGCLVSKEHTVSTWGRLFGSSDVPSSDEGFMALLEAVKDLSYSLGVSYWTDNPPSISAIAKELIYPYIHDIWRPTMGLPGKMVKKSIIGGRIQRHKTEGGPGTLYELDIKQAYPTALAESIPGGAPIALPRSCFLATDDIELWHVNVVIPGRKILPLPFRDRMEGSILYPAGRWSGVFWDVELRYAMACGAEVEPIAGYGFEPMNPFHVPMERLKSERANRPEVASVVKRLQVATVGLLAQMNKPSKVVIGNPQVGDIPMSLQDGIFKRIKPGKNPTPMPWNRMQVASYVWAKVRSNLGLAMGKVPYQDLVMCHTDGMIVDRLHFVPGMRLKRTWEVNHGWEAPYNGALYVDTERIKAPGKRRFR